MHRRLGSVLAALVVTGSTWLAAPSAALGITTLQVSFPASVEAAYDTVVGDVTFPANCTGSGSMAANNQGSWPSVIGGTSVNTWGDSWGSGNGGNCRSDNSGSGYVRTQGWRYNFVEGTPYRFTGTWYTDNNARSIKWEWINATSGAVLGVIGTTTANLNATPTGYTFDSTAPAGATGVRFSSHPWVLYTAHHIRGQSAPAYGGDCTGYGNLAAGAGYTEADWGNFWSPGFEKCRTSAAGSVSQDIVVTVPEDALVTFDSAFCTDGNYRTVTWYFLVSGGTLLGSQLRTNRACSGTGNALYLHGSAVAPAGAYGVKVVMDKYVYQQGHVVVISAEAGGLTGDNPGGSPDEGCEAPDGGWLDTDWLGYVGCVLVSGFVGLPDAIANTLWTVLGAPIYSAITGMIAIVQGTLDALLDLPETLVNMFVTGPLSGLAQFILDNIALMGEIVSLLFDLPELLINGLWTALGAPIYTAVNGTLDYLASLVDLATALPGAIAELFGTTLTDVLEFLFVPTTATGEAFEDFLASADDRAPVGWIVEVVSYLNGMLTAGNLAGPGLALSFPIMGATVSYDPAPITEAFAPYRPVGVAVVYLTLAMAAWRSIGRGLST